MNGVGGLATRVLAVVGLGVIIGGVDSWIRPVVLAARPATAAATKGTASSGGSPAGSTGAQSVISSGSAAPASASGPAAAGATDPAQASTPGVTTPETPGVALARDITARQASELFQQGAVFIDARTPKAFGEGRVLNAINCSPLMFTQGDNAAVLDLPREVPVVVYCDGGDCHDSHNLVALLEASGFTKLHIMVDGYPAWRDAGFDVATGSTP